MPTPLANRFIHQEMKCDFASWQEWAVHHNIHKDVVGYLSFAKQDLYDFDPKSASRAFATPRSWTFVSEFLDDEGDDDTTMNLVAGTVGEGLAVKFMATPECRPAASCRKAATSLTRSSGSSRLTRTS